jgi:hypothetical protein
VGWAALEDPTACCVTRPPSWLSHWLWAGSPRSSGYGAADRRGCNQPQWRLQPRTFLSLNLCRCTGILAVTAPTSCQGL